MHPEIAAVLSKLGSEVKDRATSENAVITLAFAMEKSNVRFTTFDYSNDLPASLLNYRLPEQEQREIVASLLQLFESGRFMETGVFWAIGKALPQLILEYLAPFLELHWKDLDESLLRQALISLENGLFLDDEGAQKIESMLRQGHLHGCLQEILQQDFASDSEISEVAERVLARIKSHGKPDEGS